jgi:L-malate glycosyltransferase
MKIGIISTMNGFPWGGSEYLWAALAKQALLEGHEVLISINDCSVSQPEVIQLQQIGAHLIPRSRSKARLIPRLYRKISRKLKSNYIFTSLSEYKSLFSYKPDILCISQGHSYEAVYDQELMTYIQSFSSPYVILSHLNEYCFKLNNDLRSDAKRFFLSAVYHIFVSNLNLKLAERQLAQSFSNALVLQNPINLSNTSILPWLEKTKISFASVARLEVGQKGQDMLFEVLSSSLWRERNWELNLYGEGPDIDYLKNLSQHYNIADRVNFLGYVVDIREVWLSNHILLIPSREEGGPPIVLVEAMLCGRTAVATDVGAVSEWLSDGKTGFIADSSTSKAFNHALNRAWEALEHWKIMGIKAHEYATNKLDHHPGKTLLNLILSAADNNKN